MDLTSISGIQYQTAQANATSASASSVKTAASKLNENSTEDELKSVLKDFESYFVEQILKEMKDAFTEDEDSDSTMGQYKDMMMDMAIEKVADQVVEQTGETLTQQLYEQMKRNYNITD